MIKFISTAVFIMFIMGAASQDPRHYNFTHFTVESGLMSYQANSCVQDEDGYIWIGTNEGLQRYDGIRYKNFRHSSNDPSSIPPKGVWQILFDKNGEMWILSTEGKAGIFDRKTFTFHPAVVKIKNEPLLQSLQVYKRLVTDEFGNIFLLLPGKELATYSKEKNEFSPAHNFFTVKPGWFITDFIQQPGTRKYWICVQDTGFAVYDYAVNKLSYSGSNAGNEKIIDRYRNARPYKIFFGSRNRVWFAGMGDSYPYTYCYDLKEDAVILDKYEFNTVIKGTHEVIDFLEQRDGTIWVTGVKILAKYSWKEKKFEQAFNGYVDDRSIDYIRIMQFVEDRERNLWVTTANNGIFRFNPATEFFTNITHADPATGKKSDAAPVAFIHDNDGSFLAGIWGEGLLRYDKDLREIPTGIQGFAGNKIPPIVHMSTSADNNFIWMAAQQGLYKYDKNKKRVQYCNTQALPTRIRELAEDGKGRLWIGLQQDGVFKWDPLKGAGKFEDGITKVTTVPSVRINKILVDKKGYIWIATFAEGAYVLDPETEKVIIHFDQKAAGAMKLPEQTVSSLLEYDDSLMIIGTTTNLLVYNRELKKLSYLGTDEMIPGFISSLEKDRNGYLWLSTTNALCRVMVANKVFVKFNRLDGIRNDYFIIDASHMLPDGRMVMGSPGTMVVFDPLSVTINTNFPEVHVTDFKVMNQSLRLDSLLQQNIIELAADENSITIDLSTLSYNTGYLLKYKLEGLDEEWKIADRSQQLIYPYLPPGKYTLHVNAIDANGKTGRNPLELVFRINPPYWRTWWFYSLLFLIIGGLFFWLDKERMKRKEAVQKMRSKIAGNLHQEVSTALSNINVLSEMARLKADKEPQKSKEFIEQIHTRSGGMIDAMDDMLWAISPENDSMEKTVERMQEYIDAMNSQQGGNIEMLVDEKVNQLKSDMQFRHEAYLLFKESIDGLTKAGSTDCRIYAGLDKNMLLFTIQCKNNNCDMQQLNNLLHSQVMQRRLDTIKATLQTDIHKSNSILTLKVPV